MHHLQEVSCCVTCLQIIGCAQFHYGFMVDSRGWPHDADEPAEYTSGELPKYPSMGPG